MRELMKNLSLNIKTLTIAFVLISCTTLQANAQPVITGVTGNPSHGSTLTISGSGFGTKSPVKPIIWADFEDGTMTANTAFSRQTTLGHSGNISMTTANQSPHSTYSVRGLPVDTDFTSLNANISAAADNGAGYPKWYVYVRRNYAASDFWSYNDPVGGCCVTNYKFFWPWQAIDNRGRNLVIRCGHNNPYCSTNYQFSGGNPDPLHDTDYMCVSNCNIDYPPPNQWNVEEYQFEDSDPGVPNGTLQFWINGLTKLDRRDNYQTRGSGDSSYMAWYQISNFYSSHWPPPDAYVYMDNFYVDSTWARVMIGDQNTFNASTRREIQLPNTWSDNSITIQVNAGSFASLGNSYLYVVDTSGRVNQQGFSLCSSCPQPPQNLTVK
jgi:hypothetical protein